MKAQPGHLKPFEILLSQNQGGARLYRRQLDLLLGLHLVELAADSPGPGPRLLGLLPPALCLCGMPWPRAQAQVLPGLPLAYEASHQLQQEAVRVLSFCAGGGACMPSFLQDQ